MEEEDYTSDITIENFPDLNKLKFVTKNKALNFLFHLVGILSLGFVYLAFYWKNLYYVLYKETDSYRKATHILIICDNFVRIICPIEEDEFILDPLDESIKSRKRYFRFAKSKYVFNFSENHFCRLETRFARKLEDREFYDLDSEVGKLGIDWRNVEELQKTFEKNSLEIELTPVIILLFKGLIHPLSIIIVFICIICYVSLKKAQAIIYMIYVVLMIIFSVIETRLKENRILEMCIKETLVKVFRRNSSEGRNIEKTNS
jgi:hypothetical protein